MEMTMDEYQAARARILATYGSNARDAGQQRAKAMAQLYVESGWQKEALAEVEGVSQRYIECLLLWGRFLRTSGSQSGDCTERKFRDLWRRTDQTASEEARFAAVAEMLKDELQDTPQVRRISHATLAHALLEKFSDGKFHRLSAMAATIGAEPVVVEQVLERIVQHGAYRASGEKRSAGKDGMQYRLVKGGRKRIDLTAFYTEAKPLLDDMEEMINGHLVHFSQAGMKHLYLQFRQLIDRMAR